MRRPIVDPLQRGSDYAARRQGVAQQRDLDAIDRSVAKRLGAPPAPVFLTIGPFFARDLAGTASTTAQLGFFTGAGTVAQNANKPTMPAAGEVIGALIVANDTRTAGTATVSVSVSGTTLTFAAGAVAIDATNTTADSGLVSVGAGVPFVAGDTLAPVVVTSGWTPTTADVSVWLIVQFVSR